MPNLSPICLGKQAFRLLRYRSPLFQLRQGCLDSRTPSNTTLESAFCPQHFVSYLVSSNKGQFALLRTLGVNPVASRSIGSSVFLFRYFSVKAQDTRGKKQEKGATDMDSRKERHRAKRATAFCYRVRVTGQSFTCFPFRVSRRSPPPLFPPGPGSISLSGFRWEI